MTDTEISGKFVFLKHTNQEIGDREISAIPNSNEKFMSFKIGDMKFIDSYAFRLGESLDKL